jgi:hypothetical protein
MPHAEPARPRRHKAAPTPITARRILAALANDPQATDASREWAKRLLRGEDGRRSSAEERGSK